MSITLQSDFRGEIVVANKTQPDVSENLDWFIAKYEPIFINDLMGDDLYTAYVSGLAVMPTPDPRWLDLQAEFKGSVIAPFIYRWYSQDQLTQTNGVGEKLTTAANAMNASSWPKVVRAWNEMLIEREKIVKYLDDNRALYPEYTIEWPGYYWYWGCGWFWFWPCVERPVNIYVRINGLGI